MTSCSDPSPPVLAELGSRICIMGPSNSGKSTLAAAIGRKRGLPVVHLDQLSHYPDQDWKRRPLSEFMTDHDAATEQDSWVMEGNYSACLPQRLRRATGFILLDIPTVCSLKRYFVRELSGASQVGRVYGARRRVSFWMIAHIVGPTRRNRRRYYERYADVNLPKRLLPSARTIADFWTEEQL